MVKSQLAQYEYLESLGEWERLKNAATREDRIEEEEEEYREKKRQAEAELKQVKDQQSDVASKRRTYLGAGAVVALIGIVGVVVSPFTLIATVLGLGVAGYGYLSFDPDEFDSKIDSLDEKVEEHDTELTKLEGRKDDLSETEAEDPEKELQQVEQQIEELDRPLPSTLDECSDLKSEAEEKLEDIPDKSELESEEERLREQRSEKREEIRSKKDDLEAARKERESYAEDEIKDQISSLKQEIVGEEQDRDEIAATLEERAEDLYVEADKETVNSAKASLQTEIRNDKEQIENREDIQDQIEEKNDRIGELRSEIDGANDEIASLKENIEEADADPDIEQEEELNGERDQIVGKLGDLRGRRDDLREELNISEELELDKVKDEVQEKEHEMQLYDYAEEIVSKSKDQIMRNILPKTEANMARFLPILTNGRYKDVRIDADSYTIEAYDGRAQAYKSKSIFSGGTKDQFSLALRLSFAMATLPQERGTAPDFLYLDEPVGSFDSSRQEALTELLTRGEIAENFGQIFIVSHVEGLQEEFDHRIEMEDGRIADMELEA
jgi:exonuclease SbcC